MTQPVNPTHIPAGRLRRAFDRHTATGRLRILIARVTIVAFAAASALGIWALLQSGEFSRTQTNVLLTTLCVGVTSLAILCYLAVSGTRFGWLGTIGGIVAIVPFADALILIWRTTETGASELILKSFFVGLVLAFSLAQVSLLLAVTVSPARWHRLIVGGTLCVIVLVAGVIIIPILFQPDNLHPSYWRILGILGILDALGTVTIGALMRNRARTATSPVLGEENTVDVKLGVELGDRLRRQAQIDQISRETIIQTALYEYLERRQRPTNRD